MLKFSDRAYFLPSSPIRKLAPHADAAKAAGTHVYHLNIGQPDIPTPPEFFDAFREADVKVLAYSPSAGTTGLRTQIANYYRRLGYSLETDQILVTTGASEAISFIVAAICNPGEEIIVPEPFYANYHAFAVASGAEVRTVSSTIENNFALPPIEAFKAQIHAKTRAIMICNPGNPTGVLYPKEALQQLVQLAVEHDLFLIADEVYREFVYDGAEHHSVLGVPGAESHVIVVDSISKRFSACGARIGCIISRNEELLGVAMKMAQARLCPPAFGQIGAEAVYQLPQSFYDEVVAEYKTRRDLVKSAIRKIDGAVCPEINGAFYAMVKLPVENSEDFCQWLLEEFTYEGATVMLAPGAGFYATPGKGVDEVRIAYVLNQADLAAAMQCLSQGLAAYKNREVAAS
jgi:aspartate aminotransferase